jgi:hypothetical protein
MRHEGGDKMRLAVLFIMIAGIALFGGCSECDRLTGVDPELNMVQFHGGTYRCSGVECSVAGAEGGPPSYGLRIALEMESGTRFGFSIQAPDDCIDSLLTKGTHTATGGAGDVIRTFLPGRASFSMTGLTAEDLEITWGEVSTTSTGFSGAGYVYIKREIRFVCADSVWIGGRFVKPGDPEYEDYYETYCAPDFYYPEQKIGFVCEDGRIDR